MVCESMPSMSVCPAALCFDDADKSPPVSVATSRSPILSFFPLSFSHPHKHTHTHTHTHTQSQNSLILLVEGEERERESVVEDTATPAEEQEVDQSHDQSDMQ